jgi:hypothetical protein
MEYTHHELSYEIDDEWLQEAGAQNFRPERECYRSSPALESRGEVVEVLIGSVEPLTTRAHERGIFCANRKTGESARQRVVRILRLLVSDTEVEPVKVVRTSDGRYLYRLVEGCHRFHCANAMGFKKIPATFGDDLG